MLITAYGKLDCLNDETFESRLYYKNTLHVIKVP